MLLLGGGSGCGRQTVVPFGVKEFPVLLLV